MKLTQIILCCGALGACAPIAAPQPDSSASAFEAELRAARTSVRALGNQTHSLEPAVASNLAFANPASPSSAFSSVIDVRWNGPLEGFVCEVANATGYACRAGEREPASEILIALNLVKRPLFESLADAASQSRGRAAITVDNAKKTISVDYVANPASPIFRPEDDRFSPGSFNRVVYVGAIGPTEELLSQRAAEYTGRLDLFIGALAEELGYEFATNDPAKAAASIASIYRPATPTAVLLEEALRQAPEGRLIVDRQNRTMVFFFDAAPGEAS